MPRLLRVALPDRAIAYREAKGFDHLKVALSIGIQLMVRSDLAGSGVIFTLDTETGFPRLVPKPALYVPLKAKPGKESDVVAFLKSALPLVQEEPGRKQSVCF